jgi:hypothetical protein
MYYLGLPYSHVPGEKGPRTLGIYLQGSTQPLLQMPEEFKEMQTSREVRLENDHISLDKRYHFFPQYDLLLTIPPTNNKIVARPLNIRSILDKKGIDYLYVTSTAPLGKVGGLYRYQLQVASRNGGLKYALQSGPSGLKISNTGEVTWKAPAEPADEIVIVSVKDTTGQETLHTFHVVTTE